MIEIRKKWKIIVGMIAFATMIMLNRNVEAEYCENIFDTIADVNNPENFKSTLMDGNRFFYTYKVTPSETGIYRINAMTNVDDKSTLHIYAYNEKKQIIVEVAGKRKTTGDVLNKRAYIYMVKGKTYFIGFEYGGLQGKSVEVAMTKTSLIAQPKLEYSVKFNQPKSDEGKDPVKGKYNWDSENATLTFENCEIGPCTVRFNVINSDRPEGERYYFAVDDFPEAKNIKVVFKGENRCIPRVDKSEESVPMFMILKGYLDMNDYVNVGIEFTGGGTVNVDTEYAFNFIETIGEVVINDIVLNVDWKNSGKFRYGVIHSESNIKILNSTINCRLDLTEWSTMFYSVADIVVDNSQIFVNADWDDKWEEESVGGVFYTTDKVLLNSGGLYIVSNPEFIKLLEQYMYCDRRMKGKRIEINKDKFDILSGKNLDISKLKCSIENTTYFYDGKAKTPKVTISGLTEGVHYKVEYSNNVNVGKAKFKVTGIGKFTGTIEGTFDIIEKVYTDGKLIYKKLADGKKTGKVSVIGLKKKNLKKITIKAVVTLEGKKYKVTSIAANAFKGNKKITKVTIGKNVRSIGKKAFFGCKKLKEVIIKSTKLKVGKKAFYRKGGKKLVIKVPKKLKKKYKKILKKVKTNKFIVK